MEAETTQSLVRMEIYNVLGQKVAVVVNGIQDPGFHAVRWNGTTAHLQHSREFQ